MKVSRVRVGFQVFLHLVLVGHVLAYYFLDWTAIGALDFQAFFHHFLGKGVITAGALLTLAAFCGAAIFGRLFCSWGCHFGALQDLSAWVLRRCGWRAPVVKTRFLHHVPVALLLVIFLLPVFSRWWRDGWGPVQVDLAEVAPWETLPGWFLSVTTFLVCGLGILLFLGTRGFCRFVCPYGAVFRLSDRWTPFRVRRVATCGTSCASPSEPSSSTGAAVPACTAACPTAIDVHGETEIAAKVTDVDCVRCHLCIEACPSGALAYTSQPVLLPEGDGALPVPSAVRYTLPRWGEWVVLAVAVVSYLAIDLVYGGHFLAATLALAEGFLAFVVFYAMLPLSAPTTLAVTAGESKALRPTIAALRPRLRQGRGWTFLGITAAGVFLLSLFPIFEAGAFKWLRNRGLRLDTASAAAGSEAGVNPSPVARVDLRQAVDCYHRALEYFPASEPTRRLLIGAYLRLGDRQRALHEARALVHSSGADNAAARRTLDWVRGQQDPGNRGGGALPK
jgi:polyferredoxin